MTDSGVLVGEFTLHPRNNTYGCWISFSCSITSVVHIISCSITGSILLDDISMPPFPFWEEPDSSSTQKLAKITRG